MTAPLAAIAFVSAGYLGVLAARLAIREVGWPRIRAALFGLRPKL